MMTSLNEGKFPIAVKTLQNLEPMLAQELYELGVDEVTVARRIVHGKADLKTLYRINYMARTALRVLVPITSFELQRAEDIYLKTMQFDWSSVLDLHQTFAIDPNVKSTLFNHAHYASLKVKDAIVDRFKHYLNDRPNVDPEQPDVLIHLHVDEDKVTLSLDSSGESLNKRGYRVSGGLSPINEVLAAGMLKYTGWNGQSDFYDPMCGSGTIAIEAAMLAGRIPSRYHNPEFGFMRWRNFDEKLWHEVKDQSDDQIEELRGSIYAVDSDKQQVKTAANNIVEADLRDQINLAAVNFFQLTPQSERGILVINPPYGERLSQEDINQFYKSIGDHLKKNWAGHECWIISANLDAMKYIGLKPSKKISLINASLPCVFNKYELFRGTHRENVISKAQ